MNCDTVVIGGVVRRSASSIGHKHVMANSSSNAEPVEITATNTQQYSDAIIATSGADANIALGSGQSISPLKLDWHLTELTEDVLQNILLGLKEFNNEIRTHAMEW